MILQIIIVVTSALGIWLVTREEDWKRWGYIIGLIGQPFWLYSAIPNKQWGIALLSLFYIYSWSQGIYNFWIKPMRK
jgi:hypothetical protein